MGIGICSYQKEMLLELFFADSSSTRAAMCALLFDACATLGLMKEFIVYKAQLASTSKEGNGL